MIFAFVSYWIAPCHSDTTWIAISLTLSTVKLLFVPCRRLHLFHAADFVGNLLCVFRIALMQMRKVFNESTIEINTI